MAATSARVLRAIRNGGVSSVTSVTVRSRGNRETWMVSFDARTKQPGDEAAVDAIIAALDLNNADLIAGEIHELWAEEAAVLGLLDAVHAELVVLGSTKSRGELQVAARDAYRARVLASGGVTPGE